MHSGQLRFVIIVLRVRTDFVGITIVILPEDGPVCFVADGFRVEFGRAFGLTLVEGPLAFAIGEDEEDPAKQKEDTDNGNASDGAGRQRSRRGRRR